MGHFCFSAHRVSLGLSRFTVKLQCVQRWISLIILPWVHCASWNHGLIMFFSKCGDILAVTYSSVFFLDISLYFFDALVLSVYVWWCPMDLWVSVHFFLAFFSLSDWISFIDLSSSSLMFSSATQTLLLAPWWNFRSFYHIFNQKNSIWSFFFFNVCLFLERERARVGRAEREGENSQADLPLSMDPSAGFHLMNWRPSPELKPTVGGPTGWATQVSHLVL